ncbi:3-methyl-2-oxobutanoate hydroxymethyltransferase 2, mitochondrial [Dorcoceras hygrometricum]|uniref:3-methyl-2-oxobutanoate hydroxymethyltransferase 2, mitochondrial n=1 Tax=Dorcoceras hygrometricum TaxID=472368 RepID=A0A2Z7C7P1_9LAMI|nr:3-methyl-2-oxobutanoate hydroxymethyltransferase 2, mitochondrial [Dorcoceras hygrometricum]
MGCPGQARTKPRSKIQPSQQSAGDRRRTAAGAANMQRPATARSSGRDVAQPVRNLRTSLRERAATGRSSLGLHCTTSSATSCAKQRPMGRPPACIGRNMIYNMATIVLKDPNLALIPLLGNGGRSGSRLPAIHESGPRPEGRLLSQPALEGLTAAAAWWPTAAAASEEREAAES